MFCYRINPKKLIFLLLFFHLPLFSYPFDLTFLPAYVSKGFKIENCKIQEKELDLKTFKKINPEPHARPIQIPDLQFEDTPRRKAYFGNFKSYPKEDFTILFFINIQERDYTNIISPSLLFAEIGESWEIFLNEHLISSRLSETESYNYKNVIITFPRDYLRIGENILCLHIKGDPLSRETGLYYGRPYLLDEILENFKYIKNYLLVFLVTVYTFVGIFYLIFFIQKTNEKYYFYFGVFSLLLAFYIFIRSPEPQILFPYIKASLIFRLEFASLSLLLPFFSLFLYTLVRDSNKLLKYLINLILIQGIFFTIISLVIPINSLYDFLFFWQLSTPFLMIFIFYFIAYYYIREVKNFRQKRKANILKSIFYPLIFSIAGNFFIGTLFILTLSLADIYINITKLQSPGLSNYGFLVFLIGSFLRVILNLIDIIDQNTRLYIKMKRNFIKIKSSFQELKKSEIKYKNLFDKTLEILIVLDSKGNITQINNIFEEITGYDRKLFLENHFTNLIYSYLERKEFSNFQIQKINNFLYSKNENFSERILKLQLPLKCYGDIPFQFFNVILETIPFEIENEKEKFLVRATPIKKNPIEKFLIKEYLKYIINSDIYIIDDVIAKITEDINEYFKEMEISMIRIGLREILINAIEHGNFGIRSEEKTKYLNTGIYHEVIKEKMNSPEYYNKKILIEYKFTRTELIYKITDEGKGFDVKKYLNKQEVLTLESLHGRGIFITRNAFDRVIYNQKGNSVVLIKKIPQQKINQPLNAYNEIYQ